MYCKRRIEEAVVRLCSHCSSESGRESHVNVFIHNDDSGCYVTKFDIFVRGSDVDFLRFMESLRKTFVSKMFLFNGKELYDPNCPLVADDYMSFGCGDDEEYPFFTYEVHHDYRNALRYAKEEDVFVKEVEALCGIKIEGSLLSDTKILRDEDFGDGQVGSYEIGGEGSVLERMF